MLLALKTTNTNQQLAANFTAQPTTLLAVRRRTIQIFLMLQPCQKRIKFSRARLTHLSFAKSDQVTLHPCNPGFYTFARAALTCRALWGALSLFLLGWFQLFFAPAPRLKSLVWAHRAFTQPSEGMDLWGSPIVGALSSALGQCRTHCVPIRAETSSYIKLPQGIPTYNSHSVLQEQDQWGSNPPELNQPGVCLFLQSQLCWPWTQIPRAFHRSG